MNSLDSIGIRHATDKASQFSRTYAKPHDYLRHIETFFAPLRDKPIKLLEIGIGGGESAQTWLEYFSNAQIYGVDIVSNTNPFNTVGDRSNERYTFACGDQSKPAFWKKFIEVYGGGFDVIIDDGSHVAGDIIITHTALWPHLNPGGIYEIEDLKAATHTLDELLFSLVINLHTTTTDIDSIYFACELCVMKKK